MKKIILPALLSVLVSVGLVSCDDDDSLPNVDFTVEFSGGVVDQNTGAIYVVQGDTLNITSVTVKNLESDKNAGITGIDYYWDYNFVGSNWMPPFAFSIYTTENTPVGTHELNLNAGVAVVGKEPAYAILGYDVNVVPDEEAVPANAQSVNTLTLHGNLQGAK